MRRSFAYYLNAALLVVVAAMMTCCVQTAPAPQVLKYQTIVKPLLANHLDFLFFAITEKAKLEAWFCLQGYVSDSTENVYLLGIAPLWVDSADSHNIMGRPGACQEHPNVIGTIHFHPNIATCRLSDVDVIGAYRSTEKVAAVVCKEHADSSPVISLMGRRELAERYAQIPKGKGKGDGTQGRTFTAVYRYNRPPKDTLP